MLVTPSETPQLLCYSSWLSLHLWSLEYHLISLHGNELVFPGTMGMLNGDKDIWPAQRWAQLLNLSSAIQDGEVEGKCLLQQD